mgnify:CR=1 FL=1
MLPGLGVYAPKMRLFWKSKKVRKLTIIARLIKAKQLYIIKIMNLCLNFNLNYG